MEGRRLALDSDWNLALDGALDAEEDAVHAKNAYECMNTKQKVRSYSDHEQHCADDRFDSSHASRVERADPRASLLDERLHERVLASHIPDVVISVARRKVLL